MTDRHMLILDFDGVLVDSEPVNFESWNRAFDELLGIRLADDHFALVGLGLEDIYQLWARTRADLELTLELKEQLLARKNDYYFSLGENRLVPMPGSLDQFQTARHRHQAIFTK